jgi:hypothetical protein
MLLEGSLSSSQASELCVVWSARSAATALDGCASQNMYTKLPVSCSAELAIPVCCCPQVRSLRMPSDVIRDVLEGVLLVMGQVR